jgi:hypothetical protein
MPVINNYSVTLQNINMAYYTDTLNEGSVRSNVTLCGNFVRQQYNYIALESLLI